MEVGCEIEESFQDTVSRLNVWALKYFISEKQGFGECLALCNALKGLLRMRWDSPWRPVDDTKIQVDGAVMERG